MTIDSDERGPDGPELYKYVMLPQQQARGTSMAMASTTDQSTATPPGQSPPFYIITSTDQAGTIVIVTAVCLIAAVVSILVRAYVLIQTGTFRLRWDDWAVALALLLAVIQTSLVQKEAQLGLGRTIDSLTTHDSRSVQTLQYADQVFYILSVWTCKISAGLFFYRLSPKLGDRRISSYLLILTGITGLAAILTLCFVCDVARPWYYFTLQGITCSAPYDRWIAVSTINVFTEILLACLAIKIFWPLQMRIATKCAAGFIFLQRLTLIVPIIGQLHFLSIVYQSRDPTLRATYSTLCKEVEVAVAIIATNIQCFRPFLLATATNYGAPAEEGLSAYGYSGNTEASVELAELGTGRASRAGNQLSSGRNHLTMRNAISPTSRSQFSARVTSPADHHCDTISICTDDSADLIIRKDLDYTVHYHDEEAGLENRKEKEQNRAD